MITFDDALRERLAANLARKVATVGYAGHDHGSGNREQQ